MNRYDIGHVEKMLSPLSDKIDALENKMNDAEIYAIQEFIKNDPKIKELSDKIKRIDHELNNIKMDVTNSVSLMTILLDKLKNIEIINTEILKSIANSKKKED